jgi:predicted RNase H-like HicB family nuclease
MSDYHINIFYSDEDQGYIADIPDLKGCSAWGATAIEAPQEMEIAKAAWIEAAEKEGIPIPEPHYRPLIYQAASE